MLKNLISLKRVRISFYKLPTYKMKSYCLKCRKDTKNVNPRVSSTSNGKTMVLSKCATCGTKKIEIY